LYQNGRIALKQLRMETAHSTAAGMRIAVGVKSSVASEVARRANARASMTGSWWSDFEDANNRRGDRRRRLSRLERRDSRRRAHRETAARLARDGITNGLEIRSVPLADAIGSCKLVDPGSDYVRAARAVGITFGDRA
jgi:hypothetical protein